jgi:SAM-dependent methyltransferase
MTEVKAPPEIFDMHLLALRRNRALKRQSSFLMERAISDAAERLLDVNRAFDKMLIIGPSSIGQALKTKLPKQKLLNVISCETTEHLPLENDFDLVISLLRLQSENDLPGMLIQLRQRLKPDGLFIAAMFGGDTLTELRQVFYKTDEEFLGGLAPHVYPMASYSQAAGLLSLAGLNQPVVDTDRFSVSYGKFETLISDLRDLGETNVLKAWDKGRLTRQYWRGLLENYKNLFSREDGKLNCSFEILWLTGWVPHESQQKPLKPGSANTPLGLGLEYAAKFSDKKSSS